MLTTRLRVLPSGNIRFSWSWLFGAVASRMKQNLSRKKKSITRRYSDETKEMEFSCYTVLFTSSRTENTD